MGELVNARDNRMNFRWQLLSTVSALALLASVYAAGDAAKAADRDSDHPPVWIELGGQLSRLDGGQEAFSSPRMDNARPSILSPSQKFERLPFYSADETGKISFEPDDSNWVFSASVLYGRSGSDKHVRQQTNPKPFYDYINSGHKQTVLPSGAKFADTLVQNSERHVILDFQAGKDVGLGVFGLDGSSVFNLGVRFAQFSAKSNIALKSNPDWHFGYKYFGTKKAPIGGAFHSNAAQLTAARSFHGIGPSLSWNASAPVAGTADRGEIALDWGLNAAILFGRQRAKVRHQTTGRYHGAKYQQGSRVTVYHPVPVDLSRAKSITVPNIGGFAGASFRYSNAKVSFGYRGDFFFGPMDGGIDTPKSENRGFFGPFATISIGFP